MFGNASFNVTTILLLFALKTGVWFS